MTVVIEGTTYYRTVEVCHMAGISRNTLFRWLKKDNFDDLKRRDRRGWRLFTQEEIDSIKAAANLIIEHKRKKQPSLMP